MDEAYNKYNNVRNFFFSNNKIPLNIFNYMDPTIKSNPQQQNKLLKLLNKTAEVIQNPSDKYFNVYPLDNSLNIIHKEYLNKILSDYVDLYGINGINGTINSTDVNNPKPPTLWHIFKTENEYKYGFKHDKNGVKYPIAWIDKENPDKTLTELLNRRKEGIIQCKQNLSGDYSFTDNEKYPIDDVTNQESCNTIRYSKEQIQTKTSNLSRNFDNFKGGIDEIMPWTVNPKYENVTNINDLQQLLPNEISYEERQPVFCFAEDNLPYRNCETLFANGGMKHAEEGKNACNELVEWSLVLNELYTMCQTYTKSRLIRFILPEDRVQPYRKINSIHVNKVYDMEPIGILTIRFEDDRIGYKHHTIKENNDKYNLGTLILFIFYDPNSEIRDKVFNVYTKYRILDILGVPSYYRMIFGANPVTYYEFLQLICYLKTPDEPIYYSEKYSRIIFLLPKTNKERGDIKGLKKINYQCIDRHVQELYKNVDTNNLSNNDKEIVTQKHIIRVDNINNMNKYKDYNIYDKIDKHENKRIYIKDNKLYIDERGIPFKIVDQLKGGGISYLTDKFTLDDPNIASKYAGKFNDLERDIRMNYFDNSGDKFITFTFKFTKYEFISPQHLISELKPTQYTKTKEERIFKKPTILDPTQPYKSIIKYRPLTHSFFDFYEIIKNFKIAKKDNVLEISNTPTFIESYYYNYDIKTDVLFLHEYFDRTGKKENAEQYMKHLAQFITFNSEYTNINFKISKKYDLICSSFNSHSKKVSVRLDDHVNTPYFITIMIQILNNLNDNADVIFYFNQIRTKPIADIIILCKKMFKETYLYYPSIKNLAKLSGFYVIFKGFTKLNNDSIKLLQTVYNEYVKYDPELNKFDIYDPNYEKYYSKDLNRTKNENINYINSFVNADVSEYKFIYLFNKRLYMKKIHFLKTIENAIKMEQAIQKQYVEKKREKQLMYAVLYATRYKFDYYDFNTDFIDIYLERTILQHMYSIDMPLIYTFEHAQDQVDKIGITNFFTDYKKQVFMNDFLIDTRNLDEWDRIKKEVRYYSPIEKYNNLKNIVMEKFNIKTSQAWLKMYELIVDNNLIKQQSGTYKTFHLCEAPGNFIAALNHYIKSETKLKFEWKAQSLNPNKIHEAKTAFGDEYGYIANYPDNWIWGADETGDITKEANIRFYKKYCEGVNLMTSDCGLPYDREDIESIKLLKVHYAQILFILHCLPLEADFIVKLYMPVANSLQISIVYLIYNLFDTVTFYKGVVNTFSKEFYMIGRGYKGIKTEMEQKLFDILNNFDFKVDLFDNLYNEDFMFQLEYVLQKIFDNYKFTFHRQLFYVDNMNYINDRYLKKIKGAIKNKNYAWIRRMHLKQISRQDVL